MERKTIHVEQKDFVVQMDTSVLSQKKGKLTIRNEKSSRLSYSLVNGFPLPSISKCRSRYETDFTVSVVSFTSSSYE